MLTRREKLLIRPWQQRRYNNHCRKVKCALPAIDAATPPTRSHVDNKLKKQQSETERSAKIKEDNCRLLQRMGTIMKTKQLDNEWLIKPPNFIRRSGIYYDPTKAILEMDSLSGSMDTSSDAIATRKSRCCACNPRKVKSIKTPEERIPWEPAHSVTSRNLSGSTATTRDISPDVWAPRSFSETSVESNDNDTSRLTLTRGALKLAVRFPPHTSVKLEKQKGRRGILLQREYCECKALGPHRYI